MNIKDKIQKITGLSHSLKDACYPDYNLKIEYLTIFSQTDNEYLELRSIFSKMGKESRANNGYKYKLRNAIKYKGESIPLIRIRKPDIHRKELGCVDFKYEAGDYEKMREEALGKGLDIIIRKDFEMIELSTFDVNGYAYLVKLNDNM